MQAIARELNNSETAFLFGPDDAQCDGVIRYFTPRVEVPTCGHATVAAMYARALEEGLDSCVLRYRTKIGVLPFEIIRSPDHCRVLMTQGAVDIQPPLADQERAAIIAALGLVPDDMDPRCPVQVASTGHGKVMIGIEKRGVLDRLTPDMARLAELSARIRCNGYFVFTLDSDDPAILSHGRMFAPAIGIAEDPVTGNANGPLGAYLVHHRIVEPDGGRFAFTGSQGTAMGRPGTIEVVVTVENGRPTKVQIGGSAVVVFRTEITL